MDGKTNFTPAESVEVASETPIYGNAPQSRFIKLEDLEAYVERVKAGTAGIADEFKV